MERDWALVVGINDYPRASVLNPLEGAVGDASRFYDWVCDKLGGDVPTAQAKLLTSVKGGPVGPIRSEITHFFEDFLVTREVMPPRRLYLYLSGHGVMPSGQLSLDDTALLMANAQPPRWPLSFGGSIWAKGARNAAMFDEVVLIMDCCRDLNDHATPDQHIFGDATVDAETCRLITAYATGWDSKSRELAFAGELGGLKQGAFTRSLLAVLRSGRMTGAVLKKSVKRHLELALDGQKRTQMPQITDFPPDQSLGNVVFNEAAPPVRTPIRIEAPSGTQPVILRFDPSKGRLVEVAGWQSNGLLQGALEPGHYRLVDPANPLLAKDFEVLAGVPSSEVLP